MRMRLGAPLVVALVALFGATQSASAQHCGAATYGCCPQPSCDAQCCFSSAQNPNRTCYKLVYDTVLEKRWQTCYKTVNETVMQQVQKTCYRNECRTEYRTQQCTVMKTVQQECVKPCYTTCYKDCPYTVCRPCYTTCY